MISFAFFHELLSLRNVHIIFVYLTEKPLENCEKRKRIEFGETTYEPIIVIFSAKFQRNFAVL